MAQVIYVLCSLTSVACAILLGRGWRRSGERLLLFSTICFALLALNNLELFLDLVVFPKTDLTLWRSGTALLAISSLLFGLIWETT